MGARASFQRAAIQLLNLCLAFLGLWFLALAAVIPYWPGRILALIAGSGFVLSGALRFWLSRPRRWTPLDKPY